MHIQSVLARGFAQPELIHIGISRQDGERQLASYRPIFAAVARSSNVLILPLIDQLCNSQVCSGTRNALSCSVTGTTFRWREDCR